MTDIEWNASLSLGVDSLDLEHKQLIAYCNALVHAVRDKDEKAVSTAFLALRTYSVTHFANEEEHMRQAHYPEMEKHKQLHAQLKQRVKIYQDTLYRKGDIKEEDVVLFVKHWLIEHVLRTDMKFRQFLEQKQA